MDFLKGSKFWSYLGMIFTVSGAACTGIGAMLQSKETDMKIMYTIQQTIEKGFQAVGKEV